MKPIKGSQIPKYDAASKVIHEAIDKLDRINVAGMEPDARDALAALIMHGRSVAADMFSTAHAAFIEARSGAAKS